MTDPSSKIDRKGRPPDGAAGEPPPTEPDLAWDAEPPILEFSPPAPEPAAPAREDPGVSVPVPGGAEASDDSPTVISKTHGGAAPPAPPNPAPAARSEELA